MAHSSSDADAASADPASTSGKRPLEGQDVQAAGSNGDGSRLSDAVARLSLEVPRPASSSGSRDAVCSKRLTWYDRMLPFIACRESSVLDWKAWANCGACLYQLGERKASRDAYRQAAMARRCFERDLEGAELWADPEVGQFIRKLDREFALDGWAANEADDVAFFTLLVQLARASEIASQRWHEILPNHYFSVMQAMRRKLVSPDVPVEQVCPDDSRPDFQRGNCLALLVTPGAFFVEKEGGAKRAKLQPCVRDLCVELHCSCEGPILDFDMREVQQPDD